MASDGPAIFDGLELDPLAPGNVSYLLWMLMGYMLVTAVLVVTLGRLGDMFGRVKIYNAGFAVFTVASIALARVPMSGSGGAVADRVPRGAGRRRCHDHGQLDRDHHGRLPGPAARHRPRRQSGRGPGRQLRRTRARRGALGLVGAVVSLFRGGIYIHDEALPQPKDVEYETA